MIRRTTTEEPERVMVYGAPWCEDTSRVRRLLTQWVIPFHYIDINADNYAMAKVARWNLGALVTPAVTVGALENPRMFAPTDEELHGVLYTAELVRVGPLLL